MSFQPLEPAPSNPPSQTSINTGPLHPRSLSRSFTGASNPIAVSQSSHEHLNSHSCVTCRRRKVRCNKRLPCSNCIKAGIECVFPAPGRAPRKQRRQQDPELLSRLRRLEGMIEQIKDNKTDNTSFPSRSPVESIANAAPNEQPQPSEKGKEQAVGGEHQVCPFMVDQDPTRMAPQNLENEFGRLVIDEGRSRYVSNRFWATMGDEIEELQDILDPSSSEDEDYPSPESSTGSTGHDGFLFGFYSLSHSLRSYHPPPEQVTFLWNVYLENVAPVISLLHKPTLSTLFNGPAQNPDMLDKNSEALVLTIYFVAVVSLSREQCQSKLGESREAVVRRYRFAVEQALSKANLLNTQNLMLLQAAVIFLIGVRREDDTKFAWAMTSVVLRLAQGLGLHRDGTNFGLKSFETEIRRRLWWHICLLDICTSEDHGTDAQIHEKLYDTRLPLNVNDDDIAPDMQEPPVEREGCSEMTFSLVRFEITTVLRRVSYNCPGGRYRLGQAQPSPDTCGNMLQAVNHRMEERYLRHCDMNIPIYWVCATVARLILAKTWLIIHHPMTRGDRGAKLSSASRENLFFTSIEVIEFARLLENNEHTSKWGWLFTTYKHWHAIALILSELCVRPLCPITDRAWLAVHSVYGRLEQHAKQKKGMMWRPIAKLMKRAAAVRAKQREEMQTEPTAYPEITDLTFSSAQTGQGCASLCLPQFMPRIEAPFNTQVSMPTPSQVSFDQQPAIGLGDIDISKGDMGVITDIFPDTDFLAIDHTIRSPVIGTDKSAGDTPAGAPSAAIAPIEGQQVSSNSQLNWEEWDQVMRDFQMDLQRTQDSQPFGNVSGWLT